MACGQACGIAGLCTAGVGPHQLHEGQVGCVAAALPSGPHRVHAACLSPEASTTTHTRQAPPRIPRHLLRLPPLFPPHPPNPNFPFPATSHTPPPLPAAALPRTARPSWPSASTRSRRKRRWRPSPRSPESSSAQCSRSPPRRARARAARPACVCGCCFFSCVLLVPMPHACVSVAAWWPSPPSALFLCGVVWLWLCVAKRGRAGRLPVSRPVAGSGLAGPWGAVERGSQGRQQEQERRARPRMP